jgi:hypothetical protein
MRTVDIVQAFATTDDAANVYSKEEVNNYNNDYHNILNTKSYESNFIV